MMHQFRHQWRRNLDRDSDSVLPNLQTIRLAGQFEAFIAQNTR